MDVGAVPMMRYAVFAMAVMALGCTPSPQTVETTDIVPCAETEISGALTPSECQIEVSGQVLYVNFQPLAAGAATGAVAIDVLGEDGAVAQTMLESDVSQYLAPTIQDIDGDGRADILVPRETGNANTLYGVWIFNGARGAYDRVGQIEAVGIERTSDGLIAAAGRSSATSWAINFYKLDENGLRPMVNISVTAPAREGGAPGCALETTPGLGELGISDEAARDRFCAEPAAQVFE